MANSHSLDLESSSSQYASITDASQTGLDITGDLTIELWAKFESLPSEYNYSIVSKWEAIIHICFTQETLSVMVKGYISLLVIQAIT